MKLRRETLFNVSSVVWLFSLSVMPEASLHTTARYLKFYTLVAIGCQTWNSSCTFNDAARICYAGWRSLVSDSEREQSAKKCCSGPRNSGPGLLSSFDA